MIQSALQERSHPVRVAARRQREPMCIVQYQETEEQEWHNKGEVQHMGKPVDNTTETSGTPVIPVTGRHMPWIYA